MLEVIKSATCADCDGSGYAERILANGPCPSCEGTGGLLVPSKGET